MPTVLLSGANGDLGTIVHVAMEQAGWTVLALQYPAVDLTSDESTAAACAHLPANLAAIVHLAGGIVAGKNIAQTSPDDVDRMFSLNAISAFHLLRHALPVLERNGGGSVVVIGAQSVVHPVVQRSAYSASKAALVSLAQSVAEEGRSTNVRANAILPSIIRTVSNLAWAQGGEEQTWVSPEAIAASILHLCDEHCEISGAVIPMFGGKAF